MHGDCVLAIDLGTGGVKTALVTLRGAVVADEFVAFDTRHTPDGGAEQDASDWWAAVASSAAAVRERAGVAPADVVALSVTGQWGSSLPVDAAGEPLDACLLWMDTRGGPYVDEVIGGRVRVQGYGARKLRTWLRKTGAAPGRSGNDPIGHLAFLRNARPDVYRAAHAFVEPIDWLNARLTGRIAASPASMTAWWLLDNRDLHRVAYDDELVALSTIDRAKLPELLPNGSVVGPLTPAAATALGIPHGVPVVTATPDLHSAAVGCGAVRDYEAHVSISTSSWISCHVPFKRTDLVRMVATVPSAIPERYLVVDNHETAGACLRWLHEQVLTAPDGLAGSVRSDASFADLDDLVATVPAGSGGVVFTPWLNGERSPVNDSSLRGAFAGLSLTTSRGELIRSVYEGVAYNARWLLGAVERLVRRRLDPIRFFGGGARSDVWCRIHADVMQRRVMQVADPMLANVRGAGLLAALALGHLRLADVPDAVPVGRVYDPDPAAAAAVYEPLYRAFRAFYKHHHRIYARLNP